MRTAARLDLEVDIEHRLGLIFVGDRFLDLGQRVTLFLAAH